MSEIARYLWSACIVVFIGASIGILAAPISIESMLVVCGLFILTMLATWWGFRRTRVASSNRAEGLAQAVYGMIVLYLWCAYPGKLALLLHGSGKSWLLEMPFLASVATADFVSAFVVVGPAVVGAIVGFCAMPDRGQRFTALAPVNSSFLVFTSLALLIVKLVIQTTLQIGIPGVAPRDLGVPFISGVLAFATGFLLIVVANIGLFDALVGGSSHRIRISLGVVTCAVLSDLWVGYKQALVMEVILVPLYYILAFASRQRRKVLLRGVTWLCVAVATLVMYKYVNDYRFARLRGEDFFAAVSSALWHVTASEQSSTVGFLNRINGVDNFYAAMVLRNRFTFGAGALLDQSLSDTFNYLLYRSERVHTSFGLTQFGAMYAVGGSALLLFGSAALGLVMRVLLVALRRVAGYQSWATALTPLFGFWCIEVFFAGGMLMLYVKEALFIGIVVYLLRKTLQTPSRLMVHEPVAEPEVVRTVST